MLTKRLMASAIDYNAFENLVREYYPRLMGYAGVLLDDENAKDVVQDVFTYIWDHRRRISFGDGFQTYLFRLCWSRVLDFLKKNKRNLYVGDFADVALEADIKWVESNEDALINLLSEKDPLWKESFLRLYCRRGCPYNGGCRERKLWALRLRILPA